MRKKNTLVTASIVALALVGVLLGVPSISHADPFTVTDIVVTVGDTTWCGKSTSSSASNACFGTAQDIWSSGLGASGITLGSGDSLILTQTGGTSIGSNNFDTSENGGGVGGTSGTPCNDTGTNGGVHCDTTLAVNSGAVALSGSDKDNLADRNSDPGGVTHNEARDWGTSVGTIGGTLGFGAVYFGYADNLHSDACVDAATICLPNSTTGTAAPLNLFDGTFSSTRSTFFIGQGSTIGKDAGQSQNPSNECILTDSTSLCYDAGAILIYNTQPVPEPMTMFLGGTGLLLLGYAARRRLFAR